MFQNNNYIDQLLEVQKTLTLEFFSKAYYLPFLHNCNSHLHIISIHDIIGYYMQLLWYHLNSENIYHNLLNRSNSLLTGITNYLSKLDNEKGKGLERGKGKRNKKCNETLNVTATEAEVTKSSELIVELSSSSNERYNKNKDKDREQRYISHKRQRETSKDNKNGNNNKHINENANKKQLNNNACDSLLDPKAIFRIVKYKKSHNAQELMDIQFKSSDENNNENSNTDFHTIDLDERKAEIKCWNWKVRNNIQQAYDNIIPKKIWSYEEYCKCNSPDNDNIIKTLIKETKGKRLRPHLEYKEDLILQIIKMCNYDCQKASLYLNSKQFHNWIKGKHVNVA